MTKHRHRRTSAKSRQHGVHYYLAALSKPGDHRSVVRDLKSASSNTINAVLDACRGKEPLQTRLLGDVAPSGLGELGKILPSYPTENIQVELTWMIAVLSRFSSELCTLVSEQAAFEDCLLQDKLSDAQDVLDRIVAAHGYSFWWMEASLLVKELLGGLSSTRAFVANTIHPSSLSTNEKLLAQFLSNRIETSVSPSTYDREFDDWVRTHHNRKASLLDTLTFFRFRANFHRFRSPTKVPYILNQSSRHALIDRYHTLLDVLRVLSQSELRPNNTVLTQIDQLYSKTKDDRFLPVLLSGGFVPQNLLLDRDFFSLLESYTCGDYENTCRSAQQLLKVQPGRFDVMVILARGLSYLHHNEIPFDLPRFTERITKQLLDVYALSHDSSRSFGLLLKWAYMLSCLPVGAEIFGFCVARYDVHPLFTTERDALLFRRAFSPRMILLVPAVEQQQDLFTVLRTEVGSSVALQLEEHRTLARTAEVELPTEVPRTRLLKARALAMECSGETQRAIEIYEEARGELSNPLDTYDVITRLFRSYLSVHRLVDAAELFSDTLIKTPDLAGFLDARELIQQIEEGSDQEVFRSVSWPILRYAQSRLSGAESDRYMIWVSVDEFLTANCLIDAADTPIPADENSARRTLFFLREVCKRSVLDCSFQYESTDELETARIKICRRIIATDPSQASALKGRIESLERRRAIRSSINRINENKVHVDMKNVRSYTIPRVEEPFGHYKEIAELPRSLRVILAQAPRADDKSEFQVRFADYAIVLFVRLFETVRHNFLFSNFGLDSYLSIRIRHGTITGELRCTFEQGNLITRRGPDGKYDRNEDWHARFLKRGRKHADAAGSVLSEFSEKIDAMISEVNLQWIRIHSPDEYLKGLLNFDYTAEDYMQLRRASEGCKTTEQFVDFCLEELENRLDETLCQVRKVIGGKLRNMFNDALSWCETEVATRACKLTAFNGAIRTCRTDLQRSLDTVEEWFNRSGKHEFADALLTTIVESTANCIRKVRPTSGLIANIESNAICRGDAFIGLFDVFYILFDNAAIHSGILGVQVDLIADRSGTDLLMEVRSGIDDSVDITGLRERVSTLEVKRSGLREDIRREGGSGFAKLHKVIKHDLECHDDYKIAWYIDDEARQFVAVVRLGGVLV